MEHYFAESVISESFSTHSKTSPLGKRRKLLYSLDLSKPIVKKKPEKELEKMMNINRQIFALFSTFNYS